MLKQKICSLLLTFVFTIVITSCQNSENKKTTTANEQLTKEKDEIMKRDQVDPTNVFAIPFDDSEVEDEQEINRDEKKEVFQLPHSK